jgi:kinesin family protein 2/24
MKVQINGAIAKEVKSPEEYLALNEQAKALRKTYCTFKNDTSSRSHAICKIIVRDEDRKGEDDGSLMLIDLAGSENSADL